MCHPVQDEGVQLPVRKAIVSAAIGLHARPAAVFVRAVTETGLPVTIRKDGIDAVDARSLLELGVVEGVIPEPPGGAEADHTAAAAALRAAVHAELADLAGLDQSRLVAQRRARFRRFGSSRRPDEAVLIPTEGGSW